jgi:hypothetical protein
MAVGTIVQDGGVTFDGGTSETIQSRIASSHMLGSRDPPNAGA